MVSQFVGLFGTLCWWSSHVTCIAVLIVLTTV